jgi:hypothetical protein
MERAEKIEALESLARDIGSLVYGIREVPDAIFVLICDGTKDEALDRFLDRFYFRLGALRDPKDHVQP